MNPANGSRSKSELAEKNALAASLSYDVFFSYKLFRPYSSPGGKEIDKNKLCSNIRVSIANRLDFSLVLETTGKLTNVEVAGYANGG